MENNYVLVIGAVNIDICGKPFKELLMRDSNPGTVSFSLGGVGRNICHNLSLLDVPVKFITAIGGDAYASQIEKSCKELGIDISESVYDETKSTSCYLYITDDKGDMALAVNDTDVSKLITPELLKEKLDVLNSAKLVVIDSNLMPETIEFLCKNCTVPLFCDPVSAGKAPRLLNSLGGIHTLKPNALECEILSGVKITDDTSMKEAVSVLLTRGVKRVFLSIGARGVYYADSEFSKIYPPFPTTMVDATGAGDAFMSAIAYSFFHGFDTENTALNGLAASAIALQVDGANNNNLSIKTLEEKKGTL